LVLANSMINKANNLMISVSFIAPIHVPHGFKGLAS
jgi:hypothetical protein